jgi:hypothetical protein
MVKPKALAPLLSGFFGREAATGAQWSENAAGGSEPAVRYAAS